jgi:hypothetical protein
MQSQLPNAVTVKKVKCIYIKLKNVFILSAVTKIKIIALLSLRLGSTRSIRSAGVILAYRYVRYTGNKKFQKYLTGLVSCRRQFISGLFRHLLSLHRQIAIGKELIF